MAKRTRKPKPEETTEAAPEQQPVGALKNYIVSCDCPTPLLHNPFTSMAGSEAEAVAQFKTHNGIGDTDHDITVVEAAG